MIFQTLYETVSRTTSLKLIYMYKFIPWRNWQAPTTWDFTSATIVNAVFTLYNYHAFKIFNCQCAHYIYYRYNSLRFVSTIYNHCTYRIPIPRVFKVYHLSIDKLFLHKVIDLSTATQKWRLDGPTLSGHLLYSLVNHAYLNLYQHHLVR